MTNKKQFQAASCLLIMSLTSVMPYSAIARPAKAMPGDAAEAALAKDCADDATELFFAKPRKDLKSEDFFAELAASATTQFQIFDSTKVAVSSSVTPTTNTPGTLDPASSKLATAVQTSADSVAVDTTPMNSTLITTTSSTTSYLAATREILSRKTSAPTTRFNNNANNSIEFGISTSPLSPTSGTKVTKPPSLFDDKSLSSTNSVEDTANFSAPSVTASVVAKPVPSVVVPVPTTIVAVPSAIVTVPPAIADGASHLSADPLVYDNDASSSSIADVAASGSSSEAAVNIPTTVSGNSSLIAGTKIPLQMLSSHYSKSAVVGDPVEARLLADVSISGNLLAPKGSKIIGHIASCEKSNKFVASLTPHRKMRMGASVGLQFDAIITPSGNRVPINALPASQDRFVENKNSGRILSIGGSGNISPPTSSQLKAQGFTLALRAGASAAGPISFGAIPVGFGIMGAIAPSVFLLRPVGANEPHRRLKGFGLGVLNGLPGGFVVADCIVKGGEVAILPGDRMMAELKAPLSPEVVLSEQVAIDPRKEVRGNLLTR